MGLDPDSANFMRPIVRDLATRRAVGFVWQFGSLVPAGRTAHAGVGGGPLQRGKASGVG